MGLEEALQRGRTSGPGVEVAQAPRQAMSDLEHSSGAFLLSPPVLSVGAGPRWSGSTRLEAQAALGLNIPLRDAPGARSRFARAASAWVRSDTARAQADASLQAGLAWTSALEAREILRLRTASQRDAEQLAALAERRVKSGVGQPAELALARGDLGVASAAVLDAEGMWVEARAELRIAVGAAPQSPLEPEGALYTKHDEALRDAAAWAAEAGKRSAGLAALRAHHAQARDEALMTHAQLGPQLGVGVQLVREGTGDSVLLANLSVPIPVVDAAAFEHARSAGLEASAHAQILRAEARLSSDTSVALHELEHQREVRDMLENQALPPLREALRIALLQASEGTQDTTGALLIRQRLLGAQEQLARSYADTRRADLRFAHLTGHLLPEKP